MVPTRTSQEVEAHNPFGTLMNEVENISDHSPAVVKFFNMKLGPRPFKYSNMWSTADNFIETRACALVEVRELR